MADRIGCCRLRGGRIIPLGRDQGVDDNLDQAVWCSACGQQNRDAAPFCRYCGTPFAASGQAPSGGSQPPTSRGEAGPSSAETVTSGGFARPEPEAAQRSRSQASDRGRATPPGGGPEPDRRWQVVIVAA